MKRVNFKRIADGIVLAKTSLWPHSFPVYLIHSITLYVILFIFLLNLYFPQPSEKISYATHDGISPTSTPHARQDHRQHERHHILGVPRVHSEGAQHGPEKPDAQLTEEVDRLFEAQPLLHDRLGFCGFLAPAYLGGIGNARAGQSHGGARPA